MMTVTDDGWEDVRSQGQLVYWRRRLGPHEYLAVQKAARHDGWTWAHRGPRTGRAGYITNATGEAATSQAARQAADAHIQTLPKEADPQ